MKSISIVQPYFIPYLAYFQLISATDIFISFDNVNYIKRGWINRNVIVVEGQPKYLTIPLKNQSQNSLIKETKVDWSRNFQKKVIRSLENSYYKAPYKDKMLELMSHILSEPLDSVADLSLKSIKTFCDYLSINTVIKTASSLNLQRLGDKTLDLLQIIHSQNANVYINPIGGTSLYQKSEFYDRGVILLFINGSRTNSILDVCMYNSKDSVQEALQNFSFI